MKLFYRFGFFLSLFHKNDNTLWGWEKEEEGKLFLLKGTFITTLGGLRALKCAVTIDTGSRARVSPRRINGSGGTCCKSWIRDHIN